MLNFSLCLAFATLCWSTTTFAYAEKGPPIKRRITIMAPVTCEEWLTDGEATKSAGDTVYSFLPMARHRSWVLGLMTGLNAASDSEINYIETIDSQLIFDWVEKYCKNNRTKGTYDAVSELFLQLVKSSHKPKSNRN